MVYLLQHLAETSAERSPNKPAVLLNDLAYTYAELEQAANRLANALIAQGVGRGDRVGMFLAKSIWSVVSIHAIHKAGAAYVPLDPNAPAARALHHRGRGHPLPDRRESEARQTHRATR